MPAIVERVLLFLGILRFVDPMQKEIPMANFFDDVKQIRKDVSKIAASMDTLPNIDKKLDGLQASLDKLVAAFTAAFPPPAPEPAGIEVTHGEPHPNQ